MPRPKGISKEDYTAPGKKMYEDTVLMIYGVKLLDATKPDGLSTKNEVLAAIRETRAKVNEIINILNAR